MRMKAMEVNENVGGHTSKQDQCIYCFNFAKPMCFYCTFVWYEHSKHNEFIC